MTSSRRPVHRCAALVITTETAVVEEVIGQPGAIMAPVSGDLAEGMIRPSNIY
jgi:chaperonin GroEL